MDTKIKIATGLGVVAVAAIVWVVATPQDYMTCMDNSFALFEENHIERMVEIRETLAEQMGVSVDDLPAGDSDDDMMASMQDLIAEAREKLAEQPVPFVHDMMAGVTGWGPLGDEEVGAAMDACRALLL